MKTIRINEPFVLESGKVLEEVNIAFHTYGKINERRDNVVWVCHALTANCDVCNWWKGLFGKDTYFDPERYFIVCPNILGSCYGTTGPVSPLKNRKPLLDRFPEITTRDMAKLHEVLRKYLIIDRINVLIGASLGGQQALEWAIINPTVFDHLLLIATNARHSPYGIAFNESQRWAIQSDPEYGGGNVHDAKNGLALARSIAMISYRSYSGYVQTQSDRNNDGFGSFKAASYQRYQGQKLAARFNAYSYVTLSKAMDSHNVGRDRASVASALGTIKARTLCIGIKSDALFPVVEQRFLAGKIWGASFIEVDSEFGHDGFLIETEQLKNLIRDFLENDFRLYKPTVFRQEIDLVTSQSN